MIKKIRSRYGVERIITLLDDGTYKVEGESLYSRFGEGLFDVDEPMIIESIQVIHDTPEGTAGCILHVKKDTNVKILKKSNRKNKQP